MMDSLREGLDENFIPRLMAIVESNQSDNERIRKAMDLCAAYVAASKAQHGVGIDRPMTEQERRRIEREIAPVRRAIAGREALLPEHSKGRLIMQSARAALDLDAAGSNQLGEILKHELVAR